ncbi:MAG: BBP7 family outer membrane beta-barrel protein [Planctomycetota bacterium]
MRRFDWALLTLLFLGGQAWGQSAPPVVNVENGTISETPAMETDAFDSCGCSSGCCNLAHPWRPNRANGPTGCSTCDGGVCGPAGKFFFDLDYLFWRVNGDRLPPLVTTGPGALPPVATAGVLPAATVLFGNNVFNNDFRSGLRGNIGMWLNQSQTLGVQAGGFYVLDNTATASFASDGSTILARPFTSVSLNAPSVPSSQLISYPTVVSGGVNISERNTFSGADFAFRGNACCGDNWRIDALVGYRYLRFTEQFQMNQRIVAGPNAPANIGVPVGTIVETYDRFDTGNEFQGAQIGFTGEYRFWQRFHVSGTAKASFGYVNQGVGIDGATRFSTDTTNRVGGLLALNSNIGIYRNNDAALVPELTFLCGYQANDNIRIKFGYNFMCLPNVQRPGNAIDLGIDRQRIPPPLAPTVDRPIFNFRTEDLIVQGLTAGIEIRY